MGPVNYEWATEPVTHGCSMGASRMNVLYVLLHMNAAYQCEYAMGPCQI